MKVITDFSEKIKSKLARLRASVDRNDEREQKKSVKLKEFSEIKKKRFAQLAGKNELQLVQYAELLGIRRINYRRHFPDDPDKNVKRDIKSIIGILYHKEIELGGAIKAEALASNELMRRSAAARQNDERKKNRKHAQGVPSNALAEMKKELERLTEENKKILSLINK